MALALTDPSACAAPTPLLARVSALLGRPLAHDPGAAVAVRAEVARTPRGLALHAVTSTSAVRAEALVVHPDCGRLLDDLAWRVAFTVDPATAAVRVGTRHPATLRQPAPSAARRPLTPGQRLAYEASSGLAGYRPAILAGAAAGLLAGLVAGIVFLARDTSDCTRDPMPGACNVARALAPAALAAEGALGGAALGLVVGFPVAFHRAGQRLGRRGGLLGSIAGEVLFATIAGVAWAFNADALRESWGLPALAATVFTVPFAGAFLGYELTASDPPSQPVLRQGSTAPTGPRAPAWQAR